MILDQFEICGTRVNVTVWNPTVEARATVIALHGFGPGGQQTYSRTGPRFARREIRFVAPDLPGFGKSMSMDEYSLSRYSEITREIADQYATPATVLLGHSFGAKVVLAAACDEPAIFAGFVLANPGGFSGTIEHLIRLGDITAVRLILKSQWFYKMISATRLRSPVANEYFKSAAVELSGSYGQLDLQSQYGEYLPGIDIPGQLIWGEADPILSNSVIDRVRKIFPGIIYSPIADAGHAPMRTRPQQFTDSIVKFLETVS